jgi:CheY-like chemotaxis protein
MEPTQLGKEDSMQRTGSILVVDQEPIIVDLLVEILTDEGYVVYSAPDGAGTLAAVTVHLPTLILLDMHLPGLSGATLIAHIRAVNSALLPIVLMTTASPEARPLLEAGAIEWLAKPFDIDDLLSCIARYVPPAVGLRSSQHRAGSSAIV